MSRSLTRALTALGGCVVGLALGVWPAAGFSQVTREMVAAAREEGRVVIYSTTDDKAAAPLIRGFEAQYPGVRVDYRDMNSIELYRRFRGESDAGASADLTWSSAMDLQVKLVNDGYAQPYRSVETASLPAWAVWKNEAFGTTFEPIVFVYDKRQIGAGEVPQTHSELAAFLAARRSAGGKAKSVTTYDPERSGLGLLLHSQDLRANPTVFWGLAEAMGAAGARLETRSADMLASVAAGDRVIAYNVLGSYAWARAAGAPSVGVVFPRDYTLVLSRVAFIARRARHPNAARLWLDYLLSVRGQATMARDLGFFSPREDAAGDAAAISLKRQLAGAFRPIVIGSGLLAYLDQLKRRDFLKHWNAALAAK